MRWGIGVAAGGRLWLALGIESHRVYWASRTALLRPSGGSIEAWGLIEERARERECGGRERDLGSDGRGGARGELRRRRGNRHIRDLRKKQRSPSAGFIPFPSLGNGAGLVSSG